MSERRRMLYKKGELVTEGLLFWLDGLNDKSGGGYTSKATNWYAYMTASSLNGFYVAKQGTVNRLSNGFQIPYNGSKSQGGFISNVNPFIPVNGGNYTLIEIASNVRFWTTEGSFFAGNSNYYHAYRYECYLNGSRNLGAWCANNGSSQGWTSPALVPSTMVGSVDLVYRKNGSYDNVTLHYGDTTIIGNNIASQTRSTASDMKLLVGFYDGAPNYNSYNTPGSVNWKDLPGTYHAVLLYNRNLSDAEVTQNIAFLKARYNLT